MDLEYFVDLEQYTDRDIDAIVKVAPNYLDTGIDMLSALHTLHQHKMITKRQYKTLARKFAAHDDKNRFATFILDVLQLVSFREFIRFLHLINCKSFAEELEVERYHRQMYFIEGNDVPNGTHIVKYYTMMKRCSDNDIFYDRRDGFLKIATDFEQKLPNIQNRHERQWAADRYATLMQLRTKHYNDSNTIEAILEEMRRNMPEGIETLYTDVLYHCKFGMSRALRGNEVSACDHIRQVHILSSTNKNPFIRTFSFYYLQHIYRCLYSQNPSQENLFSAVLHCNLGLDVLTEMDQTDIELIRRVFQLNLAQTLLGIRNDFSINHSIPLQAEHLYAAEQLLLKLEQNFSRIESRREMIYSLCKARTLQDNDLFLAMAYLDRALVSGKEGAYLKTNTLNIAAYQNWLLLRELPWDW